MLRLTCSLRFEDGQTVSAKVSACTNVQDATVSYSGAVERLPISPQTANVIELRAYFASFARELGADLTEDMEDDKVALNPTIDELLDGLKALAAKRRKLRRQQPARRRPGAGKPGGRVKPPRKAQGRKGG